MSHARPPLPSTEVPVAALKVLLVDDEPFFLKSMHRVLGRDQFEVFSAETGREGLRAVQRHRPDVAVLDLDLPDIHGCELLARIQERWPELPCIVLTGRGDPEAAVSVLGRGVDYLEKPIDDFPQFKAHLRRVARSPETTSKTRRTEPDAVMLGNSPAMRRLRKLIARAARFDAPVLITGESGVGKEVVAEGLHLRSGRTGKLVDVNTCAYPDTLFDSFFFGHERGAFSGADESHDGFFEQAHGGTLFLDEIGDMPLGLQPKLLRVLEKRVFRRMKGRVEHPFTARVVAATHRDLKEQVRRGDFRQDLFYRLNTVTIRVPPLRERREDVPLLAWHFVRRFNSQRELPIRSIAQPAMDMLMQRTWVENNVRELRSAIQRAAIFCEGDTLELQHFEAWSDGEPAPASELIAPVGSEPAFPASLLDMKRTEAKQFVSRSLLQWYLQEHLKRHGFNIAQTADAIGMQRSNLSREIRKLGIEMPDELRQETLIKVPRRED